MLAGMCTGTGDISRSSYHTMTAEDTWAAESTEDDKVETDFVINAFGKFSSKRD